MNAYPTPHINACPEDFAPTVLMPGDPLRSKFIAENFLEGARLVNNVRGVHGYTGTYKGSPVSVMASGMGMPSIGIYSYELFNFFGVENIIRVGSAGALNTDIHVRDIVIGQGACTDSAFANNFRLPGTFAPITVQNFVDLANSGFYDGLTFHRIVKGFMIQGGDPKGNGTGGSSKTIKGEFSANGVENKLSHERGVISMARSQDYNSASSQFFIMHADNNYLDGQYAAFGKVTDGMDVVDKIADVEVSKGLSGEASSPVEPVIIEYIKILED